MLEIYNEQLRDLLAAPAASAPHAGATGGAAAAPGLELRQDARTGEVHAAGATRLAVCSAADVHGVDVLLLAVCLVQSAVYVARRTLPHAREEAPIPQHPPRCRPAACAQRSVLFKV